MSEKLTRAVVAGAWLLLAVGVAAWHGAALIGMDWAALALRPTLVAAVAGFVLGGLLSVGSLPLTGLYLWLHEGSHALAAVMTGRRVRRFRVGRRGGSVEVERPNAFIALAPYWLPAGPLLAAALWALIWGLWRHPALLPIGAALVGAAFAWHLAHCMAAVRTGQSDFDHAGTVVSVAVIAAANLAVLYWGANAVAAATPDSMVVAAVAEVGRFVQTAFTP